MVFCFPKGLGLDPGSVSRRCQLLSLQPALVGRITQRWINTKVQFCSSCNLETYHRTYLRSNSVIFLHFQSLHHFIQSEFGVTPSFLMKLSFSQNQIFNRKLNSYINFFLVLRLNHLWLISNLLSYSCFN